MKMRRIQTSIDDAEAIKKEIQSIASEKYKGKRKWKLEIPLIIDRLGLRHSYRNKKISARTREIRQQNITQFFSELDEMGYVLQSIYSLKPRHIQALFSKWEKAGLSAATLQSRHSVMNLLCRWMGKPIVQSLPSYLENPIAGQRTYIAQEDKSWTVAGVIPEELIAKAMGLDKYVGHQLLLIREFGLRRKEAVCFRPHICFDRDNQVVQVYQGTKGGRYRVLPVRTESQREALEACCKLAKRHSDHIGDPDRTLEQNLRRFQYVLEQLGATRDKLGITAHGLRHEYANNRYQDLTGEKSPLQGGSAEVFVQDETKAARRKIAEELGHSRLRVTTAYYGSSRESTTKRKLQNIAKTIVQEYQSTSQLERHIGLIERCLTAGLGTAGTLLALREVGVEVTELELDAWVSSLNAAQPRSV